MKNKGFATIAILGIILGALIIGGGAYYLGTKKEVKDNGIKEVSSVESQKENNNEEVINIKEDTKKEGMKTQVNVNAGYQIDYPSDWYVKSSDTKIQSNGNYGYNSFVIQNTKDAVLPGSDFGLKTDGSYINISVDTNMNYANYEEFIKDPKTNLPESMKVQRLANLEMINIGGKTLQVFTGLKTSSSTIKGKLYNFIYNNKQYSLSIISGSETQFNKDKKVFEDMISSFKFINQEKLNEEMEIILYFGNSIKNPQSYDCNLVYPVKRKIPKTQAVARATLEELIKGPTKEEEKLGYYGTMPKETKINSINIKDGILFIDFSKEIENNFASCSGSYRLTSIGKTMTQFSSVKDIKLAVNGNWNMDEILQP